MAVTKQAFSKDEKYTLYKLTNASGTELHVTTFGARLVRFIVKDKTDTARDVVAGFESYEKWIESLAIDDPYFGATVGRVAGRIYPCDDVTVANQKLSLPEIQPNKVCLHGGKIGFDKKQFSAEILSEPSPSSVRFTYVSPDGEEGFPGEVEFSVTYSLSEDNAMTLTYGGRLLDGTETILNPTNHTYWNLTGFEEPTIHNHMCSLTADRYMATRPDHIMVPTGECASVKGTNLDFVTAPRRFGDDIETFDKDTLRGYDHVFVASDKPTESVREVARLWSDKTGLQMTVLTDQPCVVVYTGNWISDKLIGKDGVKYGNYAAVALETQRFTNAVNLPQFRDQVVLHPGDNFTHTATYKFNLLA